MRWEGYVACTRSVYEVSIGKPEGNRPLGRQRHRWDENIETDFKETEWECVDWIHLDQEKDQWWASVNNVKNLWFP
jgi:hypothetical protein